MSEWCKEFSKVLHMALFVLMCHVATACASLGPNEHEALAGRVLMASEQSFATWERTNSVSEAISFVQPVDDSKDALKTTKAQDNNVDIGFLHAFVASISVIIVSELGDKTFFIAAIMSMRHSRFIVFTGAMFALGLMTVLSACLGYATTVIPRKYTLYISTALFIIFGLRMLKEGYEMDPNEGQEELEEVQAELKKKDAELEKEKSSSVTQDVETGVIRGGKTPGRFFGLLSPILLQSFTLTFLAEWGDRSQLATILLASRENVIGVILGGTMGHALCTGLAVIGGRLIAQRISVRTVTIIGGVVFLVFALSAFFIED